LRSSAGALLTSDPGDLILDPFSGSNSTALAAIELGRRCVALDISEEYTRIARERVRRRPTPDR